MAPIDDYKTCSCEGSSSDWCEIHAPERDTDPCMPAFREVAADDDDDRCVVATDIFSMWQATPEPRIPLAEYAAMFADVGEDIPTTPDCPSAKSLVPPGRS